MSNKRKTLKDFLEGPIPFVERQMLELAKHGMVLDLGCGKGPGMKRFSSRGWKVIGLDPSRDDLTIAREHGECVLGVGEALPFRKESFDAVICSGVFHHAISPMKVAREISETLKDKGFLLMAEMLEDNPILRLLRDIKPYFEGIPVRQKLKKMEIQAIIEKTGFEVLTEKNELLFSWVLVEFARRSKLFGNFFPFLFPKLRMIERKMERPLSKYLKDCYLLCLKRVKK